MRRWLCLSVFVCLCVTHCNTEVPPAKRTRIDGEPTSTGTMDADTHNQLPSQPAAAAADSSAQQLSLPGPELSAVALQQQYTELLGSCQLDTFDSTASRAYHSAFHTLAEESAGMFWGHTHTQTHTHSNRLVRIRIHVHIAHVGRQNSRCVATMCVCVCVCVRSQ